MKIIVLFDSHGYNHSALVLIPTVTHWLFLCCSYIPTIQSSTHPCTSHAVTICGQTAYTDRLNHACFIVPMQQIMSRTSKPTTWLWMSLLVWWWCVSWVVLVTVGEVWLFQQGEALMIYVLTDRALQQQVYISVVQWVNYGWVTTSLHKRSESRFSSFSGSVDSIITHYSCILYDAAWWLYQQN